MLQRPSINLSDVNHGWFALKITGATLEKTLNDQPPSTTTLCLKTSGSLKIPICRTSRIVLRRLLREQWPFPESLKLSAQGHRWAILFHQHNSGCSYAPGLENSVSFFGPSSAANSCHEISLSTVVHIVLHLSMYSRSCPTPIMSFALSRCSSCRFTPSAISRAIAIHGMSFNRPNCWA